MLPALVLTAGLGTRLDPITRLVAKPAVPLAGRALIERVLEGLVAQGVTDAVLNLHHRPDTITSIVGDGTHLGLGVRYSWESPILGSAGGPRRALALLDADTFLIVNGDTICDVALAPMIAAHRASGANVTMAVVPNPAPNRYNGILLDEHDRVSGFVPRGHAVRSWHFVGVQVVQAAVFASLPDGVPAETVHGVYRSMVASERGGLRGHRVNDRFFDVGTPRDYLDAALALSSQHALDAGAAIAPGARVTRSVVWPGATVGPHAVLDDCVVTDVQVPAGFRASQAVLVPAHLRQPGDLASETAGILLFPIRP